MVKYISGYKGDYRIFAVSKNSDTTKEMLSCGLNVGEFIENKFILYPDEIITELTEKEIENVKIFEENDVLDISENGIIYRWYSVVNGDAGIATTPKCNSNCIMCPASDNERRKGSELPLERIELILKHLPDNLWYFTLTGGEPTLVGEDKFIKIISLVKKYLPHTKIQLLTNGRTLGDKTFFERLSKNLPEYFRVAIPIHSSTPEKHDFITRSKGSFVQTMRAIANFLSVGQAEVELRIVVSKLNSDDILNIAKLISNNFPNVTVVNFVGLEMRGNCVVYPNEVLILYQEAFDKSKEAIIHLVKNGIDVGLYNFPYCMIDKKFWSIAKKNISAYKSEFYNECDSCIMRNECCGIFTATKNFYKPKVFPIVRGDLSD